MFTTNVKPMNRGNQPQQQKPQSGGCAACKQKLAAGAVKKPENKNGK